MKRTRITLLAAACLLLATTTLGQMLGVNPFKKPNIADIFRPVVGSGAVYETQHTGPQGEKGQMEMNVVGREMVDGKDGYWLEMGMTDKKTGQMAYGKMLVTKDDFQFHRMIWQQPSQPAMEFPVNFTGTNTHMKEELDKWHEVGTETITVPAGTFSCHHWKKDQGVGDVWASDKVSPMGMVKSVNSSETMVLVKIVTGATDHITGPVTKFDPEALKRQIMERPQQQKQ